MEHVTCGYVIDRLEITSSTDEKPERTCLRPTGHRRPHLILNGRNEYVTWEYDECDNTGLTEDDFGYCYCCANDDPYECCLTYGTITPDHARKMIAQGDYEGD